MLRLHVLPPFGPNMICKYRPGTTGNNSHNSKASRTSRIRTRKAVADERKPFQCQKCGRGFTLKRNKDRHVNYECGHEPRFQCPYCGLRSKQTSPVYAHIRKKHPEEEHFVKSPCFCVTVARATGVCRITGSSGRCLAVLKVSGFYAAVPQLDLNYILQSGKGFDTESNNSYYPHVAVRNTPDKPFRCPKCGRSFTVKGNMTRHFKYECGQPPRFQCPYCKFRSKQTSNVMSHIRTRHAGQRVYVVNLKVEDKLPLWGVSSSRGE
ncbi:PREDICTED: zinc finger protein 786-like [Dinoponera quadriceps]|uniref:Zinc finger protein 786-like n=1 Tax=Dinoponera quadriceps TaxID=609295 RepID=A0A6P3X985_DINQU|nr:PREDICTED: zinc finger protein 786-like [Dinoponera quadriceps]